MSITVTSQPTGQQDDCEQDDPTDDPWAWFKQEILHDPRVCTSCFTAVRKTATDVVDEWGNTADHVERTDDTLRAFDHDDPPDTVVAIQPLARQRTTCRNCGSIGCTGVGDTMSRREMLRNVPRLLARLEERGHDPDEGTLRGVIRRHKTDSEFDGEDARIYAVAAALAV